MSALASVVHYPGIKKIDVQITEVGNMIISTETEKRFLSKETVYAIAESGLRDAVRAFSQPKIVELVATVDSFYADETCHHNSQCNCMRCCR